MAYGAWGGVSGFFLAGMVAALFCSAEVTFWTASVCGMLGYLAMTLYGLRTGNVSISWHMPRIGTFGRRRTRAQTPRAA